MSTYDTTLANKIKDIPNITNTASNFYNKYATYINKYKGGMPAGFLAAIAAYESDGKMIEGDPDLGEYGFFQITSNFPSTLGLSSDLRKTIEGNIFLAGVEYNIEAKRLKLKYPNLIVEGSEDQWKLARLVFAIGKYGTDTCIKNANPQIKGQVFKAVEDWANTTGAIAIGSSPASKIKMRINAISQVVWPVAEKVGHMSKGVPVKPPYKTKYLIPKDIRDHLKEDSSLLIAAGAALLAKVLNFI